MCESLVHKDVTSSSGRNTILNHADSLGMNRQRSGQNGATSTGWVRRYGVYDIMPASRSGSSGKLGGDTAILEASQLKVAKIPVAKNGARWTSRFMWMMPSMTHKFKIKSILGS